jgi:hypothetical protein
MLDSFFRREHFGFELYPLEQSALPDGNASPYLTEFVRRN